MTPFVRPVRATLVALFAFAAACGGDEAAERPAPAAPPATGGAAAPAGDAPAATGNVIEVRMVTTDGGASGVFEPAEIDARPGDVIRFIQADGMAAHNVQFPPQRNPSGTRLPPPSRYTTRANETIEIAVTMDPGSYYYECLPHASSGMVGTVNVR